MARDKLFDEPREPQDFAFDGKTAAVFDDMVRRSVPLYDEMQRMCAELAGRFAVDGTKLYDLGCATGTTLVNVDRTVPAGVRFVGVDFSAEMLAIARGKLSAAGCNRPYELVAADLCRPLGMNNASVCLMILTLQFVRPPDRARVLADIFDGLNSGGCLILVEKTVTGDSLLNRLFIESYHALKERNGYSQLEIAQKREALENVLIPYRLEENRDLLLRTGFRAVEVFLCWYNFCGLIALK
jgi:tRNA (cmo5U34)-methyltransferase